MTATQARAALPEILDRVLAGEEVTITRHGRAVAVVVRPDTMRVRRADQTIAEAERIHDLLERGRSVHLDESSTISARRADQLVADIAQGRSR